MGGEIKVVKKNSPGTLMQLYLLLGASSESKQIYDADFPNTVVVLATVGSMERMIISQWLRKKKVSTLETSEWHELTRILRELLDPISPVSSNGFDAPYSSSEPLKAEMTNIKALIDPVYVVVIDITLLDLSSDLWREQLNSLTYSTGKRCLHG